MAEIILEPTTLSKVIPLSLKVNEVDISLTGQIVTKQQFNTADTDAWFSFTLDGLAATTGTFDLTLINLQDKSVFNHDAIAFNTNPFYYKLDSGADELTNEIRHVGKWVGQLVVTLPNGDSATRKFIFAIEGHILDGTVVQTILLEDYNTLIADIEASKDELTQYNIDYASLIGTVTSQEAAREQAELTRTETFNALVDSEIIAQNVATELQNVEATYAPRLLSAEQQLVDTLNKSAITLTHMFSDNTARDTYFIAHPTELIALQFVKVGTTYQQYIDGVWTDSVPIIAEQVSATNQPILDIGGYFTAENTNEALQELGIKKANKVQESWFAPTLINGWSDYVGLESSGYFKDEFNIVYLKGVIASGSIGSTIMILPVGYRPKYTRRFSTVSNDAFGFVEVLSTGAVYCWVGSSAWVSLDGIIFRAE